VSESSQSSAAQESDLIDRIANALPVEVRADYYREMRHCRSLPENDEMLRILRAMGFLVLLMVQAPERMATERLRLEEAMADALRALHEICECNDAYRAATRSAVGTTTGRHRGRDQPESHCCHDQ